MTGGRNDRINVIGGPARGPSTSFCSAYPAFELQARPVIAVEDAIRGELEAIEWRDS
jgi:hypothetical protein